MRFHAEHRLPAPVDRVMDALADPAFYHQLELPDLELREVVEHADDGDTASVVLRYEYVGDLDPMILRLLGGRRLTWLQSLVLERGAGTGRLEFAVEASPDKVQGRVDFEFVPDGEGTLRLLDGELTVRVRLIGGTAERRLVPGVLHRLDLEAEQLTAWLAG